MTTIKILREETFTDCAEVVDIYGQGCNYPTKKGVDGFQVDFDIEVTNDTYKTKEFHITYQNDERTDNITAYNGIEMSTGARFGCDADESRLVFKFLCVDESESDILDILEDKAIELCREWLNNNIDKDDE